MVLVAIVMKDVYNAINIGCIDDHFQRQEFLPWQGTDNQWKHVDKTNGAI